MKKIISACLALSLLILCGCGGMASLYCLPEPSDEALELQEALKEVQKEDLSYLVPTGGSRQEAVQLMDLDRDGTEEAVAFFRAGSGGVRMAVLERTQEAYQVSALVECSGDAITSVDYRDLTGDGVLEIILSCQLSEVVTQGLYIYGYGPGGVEQLLSESCGRYCLSDLNGDQTAELYCIAGSGSDTSAVVKSYQYHDGAFLWVGDQSLQSPYGGIRRIREEKLSDGQRTLLITSLLEDGTMVHDLLCTEGQTFGNLSTEGTQPMKNGHIRGFYAYPQDMDGDGTVEFATAEELPAWGEDSPQYIIRWQGYSARGTDETVLYTYHHFSGLWYMTLPEAWEGNITVRQREGEVTFCRLTEEEPEPFLTIYTLKGEEGQAFVEENELTLITSDNDRIIAVGLSPEAENWDGTITTAEAAERFHMIYSSEIIGQTE